jgi:hypothetical protein
MPPHPTRSTIACAVCRSWRDPRRFGDLVELTAALRLLDRDRVG